MSLHAQLSPEAQAKLATMKRNSTISSIIIALLLCAALVAILWWIAIEGIFKNNEETLSYAASSDKQSEVTKPEMTNEVVTKPSSPSSNTAKVIAASTPSPTAVPVPEITTTEPSLDFGDGSDFGEGWGSGSGDGSGAGSGGFGIPASMQKRCSPQDRLQRLTKEGGDAKYEERVVNALRWFKKTQQKDGSWNAKGYNVGQTGLALLCFLGHCETPTSVEFGETVQNAILYLINHAKNNNGRFGNVADNHWCYEHSICTYAMAEAYTLCKQFKVEIPGLDKTVVDATKFILANQHKSGGWDYAYDTSGTRGGDSSIVCWHLQALKAAKLTKLEGLEVRAIEKSAKSALKYLASCESGSIKGAILYRPGQALGGKPTMTEGTVLCLQQWGKGKRSLARNGIKVIMKGIKKDGFDYKSKAHLYHNYYACQAMINEQGRKWAEYNETVMPKLAAAQEKDGAWPIPDAKTHGMTSRHYATCLAVLMLEVYYRFLPSS